MNPDIANAISRTRPGEMPIDWAPTSLPRSATSTRPNVPLRIWVTASATSTNTTSTSARKALSDLKLSAPMIGRGTTVPCDNDFEPPPTNGSFTMTASKKYANASVAMAVHTPPSLRIGNDSTAPSAAAITAPTRAAGSTGAS